MSCLMLSCSCSKCKKKYGNPINTSWRNRMKERQLKEPFWWKKRHRWGSEADSGHLRYFYKCTESRLNEWGHTHNEIPWARDAELLKKQIYLWTKYMYSRRAIQTTIFVLPTPGLVQLVDCLSYQCSDWNKRSINFHEEETSSIPRSSSQPYHEPSNCKDV